MTHGTTSDVFSIVDSTSASAAMSEGDSQLQARIASLRKRLRSLGINDLARPSARRVSTLPTEDQSEKLQAQFDVIQNEATTLPVTGTVTPLVDAELRYLWSELDASADLLLHIRALAGLSVTIQSCDHALSDLLEHIDSYPAPPFGPIASTHVTDVSYPPEQQMSARMAFTQTLVEQIIARTAEVSDDARAVPERDRIAQTWEELQAMGSDRLNGHKSRPGSVLSSGRHSRASVPSAPVPGPSRRNEQKRGAYSQLSAAPAGSKFLAPPPPTRRAASGTPASSHSRTSSRASMASTSRSVSGPVNAPSTNSRLFTSTFASRQRSSSIASNAQPSVSTPKPGTPTPFGPRPRARTGQSSHERIGSPLVSEIPRSLSRSSLNLSRSSISTSKSTWARAPRQSFPNIPKSPPPRKPGITERKPYVPNPKNKLDVAVGDVVNNLPVNVNIEVVADTWKDQSGKYWIGDEDPKLCFCRILRSQTVMVRVGGGWTELSK